MTRRAQQYRVDAAVMADQERASGLAHELWCKAQSLSVHPEGCIAMPHVRQSLSEVRELINAMLGERA
jgi:hypothetical protein